MQSKSGGCTYAPFGWCVVKATSVKTTRLECDNYSEARRVMRELKKFNKLAAAAVDIVSDSDTEHAGGVVLVTTDPAASRYFYDLVK